MDARNKASLCTQQSDEDLMLAYKQGDASAFDLLYQEHKIMVYRYFIRQSLPISIAEELCHDTWLKLINSRQQYQVSALFRTYLFTIARNVLIDHYRKVANQSTRVSIDGIDDHFAGQVSDDNQEASLSQQTLNKALNAELMKLSFDQREVFLLKQEAGFTIEQIADITAQHKEKVKSCWRYAIDKIRAGLSKYVN